MRQTNCEEDIVPRGSEPLLITMEELQRILSCGKTTAFAIVGAGDIEAVQVGRRRMPVFESVKAFVARLREQARSELEAA